MKAATLPIQNRREPIISSAVLGMLVFVFTEIMFFMALISSFLVLKGGATNWSPASSDVTLPVVATALNSLVLFTSGILLFFSQKRFQSDRKEEATKLLFWSASLGAFFVCFQGLEWIQLIHYGMTMTSGIFGSCFFLLIGCHAVHALITVVILFYLHRLMQEDRLDKSIFKAWQVFWYFVVGIWPLIYFVVYF